MLEKVFSMWEVKSPYNTVKEVANIYCWNFINYYYKTAEEDFEK